jgi:Amt family ammonium transporter
MTGMVMTGIFAKDVGLTSGKYETFRYHLLALGIVAVFAFGGSWLLYKITDLIIPLRVTQDQEAVGLDLSQHGESAVGSDLLGGAYSSGNGNGALKHSERVGELF